METNRTLEIIRSEIERRITDNTFGAKLELIDLLSFLDTLEEPKFNLDKLREVAVPLSDEEKEAHRKLMDERRKKYEEMGMLQEPKVDLEKEIDKVLREGALSWNISYSDMSTIAEHFYDLGKGDRDTIFHKGMMYYRKQMMEEGIKAVKSQEFDKIEKTIAGAFVKYGMDKQMEQMMKEAVEYEVGMHGEPITINLDKYVQRARGIFPGDKVRIIIIKEDEK